MQTIDRFPIPSVAGDINIGQGQRRGGRTSISPRRSAVYQKSGSGGSGGDGNDISENRNMMPPRNLPLHARGGGVSMNDWPANMNNAGNGPFGMLLYSIIENRPYTLLYQH